MYETRNSKAKAIAIGASLAIHGASGVLFNQAIVWPRSPEIAVIPSTIKVLAEEQAAQAEQPAIVLSPSAPTQPEPEQPPPNPVSKTLATQEAPPAPSEQAWAFAGQYTNKNSKAYRHTWGQHVRSLMGTAVEGPDQGEVRFRIEIAPDGKLAQLDTLWATSAVAEQRARSAITQLPQLPPTPTGKPLIFEKTIRFSAFATDDSPSYADDCLPDPPRFQNPFVWDGHSPRVPVEQPKPEKLDPDALAECLRQLPTDSIDAVVAHDRRMFEQWGTVKR